jgi:hypothetical protein
MGKRKASVKYEHNHTHNPKARESDERKISMLQTLEIKRLRTYVDKQIQNMENYIPPELRIEQKIGLCDSWFVCL